MLDNAIEVSEEYDRQSELYETQLILKKKKKKKKK